jgi:hypothetical protein
MCFIASFNTTMVSVRFGSRFKDNAGGFKIIVIENNKPLISLTTIFKCEVFINENIPRLRYFLFYRLNIK